MKYGYEGVILENPNLSKATWGRGPLSTWLRVEAPDGVSPTASKEDFDGYRRARDGACADLALVTRLDDGTPAALLGRRSATAPWPEVWWIFGGATAAYGNIEEWIAERVKQECGVEAVPQALLGVYRTCAPREDGIVGSTIQVCYAAYVDLEEIRRSMRADRGHTELRLFSAETLRLLLHQEDKTVHWYPVKAACLAMEYMPD